MIFIEYLPGDIAADYLKRQGPGLLGVLGFPSVPGDCAQAVPHASVAAAGPCTGPGPAGVCEVWMSPAPVHHGADGDIRFAISGGFLFGVSAMPQGAAAGALRDGTERAYREIFAMLGRHGFPHAVRFWNYFPRINEKEDGVERYRLFNIGRGAAFADAGRDREETIPAACALGTDSGDALTVYFVAAREPGMAVENPRQVSAYRYPPEYGPRSPTFSRAVLHPAKDAAMLFVSGTASIVGHRSLHAGDVAAQTRETLVNLEALFAEAGSRSRPGAFSMREASYKVYVRHPADAPAVRLELAEVLGEGVDACFLRADICRADLLVEIEAIAYAGDAGERPRR